MRMDGIKLKEQAYRTGDGVFAVDRRKSIFYWNQGAQQVLGGTLGELKGK